MSILQHEIPGARVVDLCAGSGALGLEALSRGAVFCDMVDVSEASLRCVRENAAVLGATDRVAVHRADVRRFLTRGLDAPWDIAFADPPYSLGLAPAIAEAWLARPFARILGIEHEASEELPEGGETRKYGGTRITIFRAP